MPKFNFVASVTVSAFTTVEAEDAESALLVAEARLVELAQGYDTDEQAEEVWVIDDADGSAHSIRHA